uniref:Uncharacterized protein n=1 Tax=Caenorhabditis japonica TaxID=281687 RepID=A0A8R1IKB0_CAEJA
MHLERFQSLGRNNRGSHRSPSSYFSYPNTNWDHRRSRRIELEGLMRPTTILPITTEPTTTLPTTQSQQPRN